MESEMTYSGNSQRAFEHASLSAYYSDQGSDDDRWERYESACEARTDAERLAAYDDFMDTPVHRAAVGPCYLDAFMAWDFDRWLKSGAWDRLTSGPDDFDVRDAA